MGLFSLNISGSSTIYSQVQIIFAVLLCFGTGCLGGSETENNNLIYIDVSAGDLDRHHSVVSLAIPYDLHGEKYHLADEDGSIIPVQISGDKLTFILKQINAGEKHRFELRESGDESAENVVIDFQGDTAQFQKSNGRPVFDYRSGTSGLEGIEVDEVFLRGGYLHPVYSPSGAVITEHYTPGRPHQNGIWTGWYKTEWNETEPDFWSAAERTGSVQAVSVDTVLTGPVYGLLETEHHFTEKISENETPILSDRWTIHSYNIADTTINLFDLEIDQENITEFPFTLKEHVYGGVGFRGSDQWIGEEGEMQFITSEGETRSEAHLSTAKWVLMSGDIDGETAAIAILSHPKNARFPEPVFINQREPFFTFAPLQGGDITLNAGDHFKAAYRYITFSGEVPSVETIEQYWQDYAHPVDVSISKND